MRPVINNYNMAAEILELSPDGLFCHVDKCRLENPKDVPEGLCVNDSSNPRQNVSQSLTSVYLSKAHQLFFISKLVGYV